MKHVTQCKCMNCDADYYRKHGRVKGATTTKMEVIMKPGIYLVYQAGIANVFEVYANGNKKRLLQHAFSPCEWFAHGCSISGRRVRTMVCNQAGDIINSEWTDDLESQPFSNQFSPIVAN